MTLIPMAPRRSAVLTATCLALACSSSPSEPGTGANLTTDRSTYTSSYRSGDGASASYGFRLVARFVNPGTQTLYLERCYPTSRTPIFAVILDTSALSVAGSAYNPAWACVGHAQQIAIAGGATRVDTLEIAAANAWNGTPGTFSGRMRLVYQVLPCGDERCQPLPTSIGTSNIFDVTRE
jgi:hypothetical protein